LVTKSNPRVRNFLIVGMAIGFVIIALGEVGDFGFELDVQLTGFEIAQQTTGAPAPVNFLTVTGLGIFLVSFGGFVFRGIYRRGF